jgi:predicted outer membrane protein
MKRMLASTALTAAAALVAACSSGGSRYSAGDNTTEPMYSPAYGYNSDWYGSSAGEDAHRTYNPENMYRCNNVGNTGDPNRDYSPNSGYSIKMHQGSWYGEPSATGSTTTEGDYYGSASESGVQPEGGAASTPANAGPASSGDERGDRYTNLPDHYTNATPGGFSNRDAWHENGARTAAPPPGGWSSLNPSTVTASSDHPNQPAAAESGVSPDRRILSILSVKDQEEIDIGQLAQSNGSTREVRDYGTRLEKDHSANMQKVRSVASSTGITLMSADEVRTMLAKENGKNPSSTKDPVAELRDLKGAAFDKTFAHMMKTGHARLIKIVEKAQKDVTNPDVKSLVSKTLPVLREHEKIAAKIMGEEGADRYASPGEP